MPLYDLRSDTVTKPSAGMRKAMYAAEVGDDVYREDPTVNNLQDLAARLTGKERGLFVPSGSMGNLIPLYVLCRRGSEVLTHDQSHILHYELSSLSAIAGLMPVPIQSPRGILRPEALEKYMRPSTYYMPQTGIIEIENTHNREGGTCYVKEDLHELREFADSKNLPIHMDGARVFNAATSTRTSIQEIASFANTMTFCLSKGLGAPVGSVICGSKEFIKEARTVRKMLGGGMRQAGILAAAGLYALENNVERLADDHARARKLADALANTSWASIDPQSIETNIIYFKTPSTLAERVVEALKKQSILCGATDKHSIRMVTHLGISEDDTNEICRRIEILRI